VYKEEEVLAQDYSGFERKVEVIGIFQLLS
jgi:hypothetical protein